LVANSFHGQSDVPMKHQAAREPPMDTQAQQLAFTAPMLAPIMNRTRVVDRANLAFRQERLDKMDS
jgi:hypothetical protein